MRIKQFVGLLAVALLLGSLNVQAQQTYPTISVESYSRQQASDIQGNSQEQDIHRGYAGSTFGSPIAFGASGGGLGAGVFALQYHDKANNNRIRDGSAGFSVGLGNADKYFGFEGSVGISSLTHAGGDNFGEAGSLGFKLHTNILRFASVAIGVTDAEPWGAARTSNHESYYLVTSKVFPLSVFGSPHALVVNLGIGNNQFTRTTNGVNGFGSLAFYLNRQVSFIVDDTGRFINAGVSVAPFASFPLSFTFGMFNIAQQQGLKSGIAGGAGIGYDMNLLP